MSVNITVMVDPPSGWRWGFPKEYNPDRDGTDLWAWLAREGYPQREIDYWRDKDFVPIRTWVADKQ